MPVNIKQILCLLPWLLLSIADAFIVPVNHIRLFIIFIAITLKTQGQSKRRLLKVYQRYFLRSQLSTGSRENLKTL